LYDIQKALVGDATIGAATVERAVDQYLVSFHAWSNLLLHGNRTTIAATKKTEDEAVVPATEVEAATKEKASQAVDEAASKKIAEDGAAAKKKAEKAKKKAEAAAKQRGRDSQF
jgi:hypothetical protein